MASYVYIYPRLAAQISKYYIFTIVLSYLLATSTVYGQRRLARSCSSNDEVCVWMDDSGGPNVNLIVEGPLKCRWLGVGVGTQMAGADICIGFVNSRNQSIVSDRYSPTTGGPSVLVDAKQDVKLLDDPQAVFGPTSFTNRFVLQFTRPKAVSQGNVDGQDKLLNTSAPVDFIYAFNTDPNSVHGDDLNAAITKHEKAGKVQVDFSNPQHLENARQVGQRNAAAKRGNNTDASVLVSDSSSESNTTTTNSTSKSTGETGLSALVRTSGNGTLSSKLNDAIGKPTVTLLASVITILYIPAIWLF